MGCYGREGMAHRADVQMCQQKAGYTGAPAAHFGTVRVVGGMMLSPCFQRLVAVQHTRDQRAVAPCHAPVHG